MKTKKITFLSILGITSILPVVAMTTISCGENTTNSSKEDIENPSKPTTPDVSNPSKPDVTEPSKPTTPDASNPSKPTTPDVSNPSKPGVTEPDKPVEGYDKTLNPTISNILVNSLNNKFEVVIEGTNLPLDISLYSFKKSVTDIEMLAQSIKEGSTTTKVTLVVTNAAFQNKNLSLTIKFGENNQYDYNYPSVISFKYFDATENQFNNYVSEFNSTMNKALAHAEIASDYYEEIYNWMNSMLSITTDTGIRVTGTKEIQTYPLMSFEDVKGSVGFDVEFLIESNSMKSNLSFKFWNPNPNIDITNSSYTAKTSNGLIFVKDTIVGYEGTSKDVKIDSVLEGRDYNGKKIKSLTIKSIAKNAFNNKNINSVSFCSTIETIGDNAFANNNLTEVQFPNSLKNLGDSSFYNNKLTEVNLKNTLLRKIPTRAFGKNLINNIVLNYLIYFIGIGAFEENKLTTSDFNSIFKHNTYITTIERGAFAYNNITLNVAGYTPNNIIYLPQNLQYLGVGAFEVKEKINFGWGSIDSKVKFFDQVGLQEDWVSFTVKIINEKGEVYYIRSYDLFNVRVVNQQYYDIGWDHGETSY